MPTDGLQSIIYLYTVHYLCMRHDVSGKVLACSPPYIGEFVYGVDIIARIGTFCRQGGESIVKLRGGGGLG